VILYSVLVMTNACNDTTCLQFKDPVSPDHIAATIGEPGIGEEIPNADKLDPVKVVGRVALVSVYALSKRTGCSCATP